MRNDGVPPPALPQPLLLYLPAEPAKTLRAGPSLGQRHASPEPSLHFLLCLQLRLFLNKYNPATLCPWGCRRVYWCARQAGLLLWESFQVSVEGNQDNGRRSPDGPNSTANGPHAQPSIPGCSPPGAGAGAPFVRGPQPSMQDKGALGTRGQGSLQTALEFTLLPSRCKTPRVGDFPWRPRFCLLSRCPTVVRWMNDTHEDPT